MYEAVPQIREAAPQHGPQKKVVPALPPVGGVGWVDEVMTRRAQNQPEAVVVEVRTRPMPISGVLIMSDWKNLVGWKDDPEVAAVETGSKTAPSIPVSPQPQQALPTPTSERIPQAVQDASPSRPPTGPAAPASQEASSRNGSAKGPMGMASAVPERSQKPEAARPASTRRRALRRPLASSTWASRCWASAMAR